MILKRLLVLLLFKVVSAIFTGYLAYYPLDCDTLDYGPFGYHGTSQGNLVCSTDHLNRANFAYNFDGASYIFGVASGFPSRDRTISVWIKPSRLTTPSGQGLGIFSYGGGNCGDSFFMIINNRDSGGPQTVYEEQGHCRAQQILYYGAPNPVSQWQHFVITTDATGTHLYLNGAQVISNSVYITNTNTWNKKFTIGLEISPDGNSPYTDGNCGYFYGAIDDLLIYDRALSNTEIRDIYTNQPPVLINYQFQLDLSVPTTITSTMLSAVDQQEGLIFTVSNVNNGYFHCITDSSGKSTTSFTDEQIRDSIYSSW